MKEIKIFTPYDKYVCPEYERTESGIYKHNGKYVIALSFQQEQELGEGKNAADISQYPLEDILDKYCVYISDFFKSLNMSESKICYLEFTGFSEKDVVALKSLVGKHVYCREKHINNETFAELVIE